MTGHVFCHQNDAVIASTESITGETTRTILIVDDDRSVADTTLKDFIAKDSVGGAFQIAVLYAIREEPEQMFKWLEIAYEVRDSGLTQLAITPFFLSYRDDPRFAALCQKLNVQLPSGATKS